MSVRNWGRETDSVLTSYRQPGSVDGKNGRDLEYEILPEGVFEIGLFGMEMMRATSGFTFEGPTPHISTTPQTPRATLIPGVFALSDGMGLAAMALRGARRGSYLSRFLP